MTHNLLLLEGPLLPWLGRDVRKGTKRNSRNCENFRMASGSGSSPLNCDHISQAERPINTGGLLTTTKMETTGPQTESPVLSPMSPN